METVLIAGGSGLIGSEIAALLSKNNFKVVFLTRNISQKSNSYFWDLDKNIIDIEAIRNVDYIINLTGANISLQKWTKSFKIEILNSRIKSAQLIYKICKENNFRPKVFISASAIGYYGTYNSEKIFTENDKSGNDFLADVCKKWEENALKFNDLNIRTVILRTGVVFSEKGGAFLKISDTIKRGIGTVIGSGEQYIPCIYIEDLANIYKFCIENIEISGVFNSVAPEHITNKQLTEKIAKSMNKQIRLPNVPEFVLKMKFGEMSSIILKGSRISSEKIISKGFKFKYQKAEDAILQILN